MLFMLLMKNIILALRSRRFNDHRFACLNVTNPGHGVPQNATLWQQLLAKRLLRHGRRLAAAMPGGVLTKAEHWC